MYWLQVQCSLLWGHIETWFEIYKMLDPVADEAWEEMVQLLFIEKSCLHFFIWQFPWPYKLFSELEWRFPHPNKIKNINKYKWI